MWRVMGRAGFAANIWQQKKRALAMRGFTQAGPVRKHGVCARRCGTLGLAVDAREKTWKLPLQTIYLLSLFGVSLMIMAAIFEAYRAVSSKAQWTDARYAPRLSLVQTVDNRVHALPFVGQDRREATAQVQDLKAVNS